MKYARKWFFIFLGAFIFSFGLEAFLVPNNIIDGGITGISIITSHLSNFSLSLFLFVFNVPFIILGYKHLGKDFATTVFFSILISSIFTALLHNVHHFTDNPLLSSIFGGILVGIGVGLVIRNGGSLDGTEIVAILLNKKTSFSVGEIVMFFNVFILLSAGFVFTWENAMLSLLAYYIAFKTIDVVIEGLEQTRVVWIISDQSEKIGDILLKTIDKSVTYLNGTGGFSKEERKVLFVICTRLEEATLKSVVESIDPKAFIAIGHIHDVKGGKFKNN